MVISPGFSDQVSHVRAMWEVNCAARCRARRNTTFSALGEASSRGSWAGRGQRRLIIVPVATRTFNRAGKTNDFDDEFDDDHQMAIVRETKKRSRRTIAGQVRGGAAEE